ncbi:hypothetical protein PAXINDRAFT_155271 [Paxillus involutus ATCC 200175]|nr:hypothetical protein PAXINDRAFT_155271 [Paxillus involutus ATCC 200175]
MYRNQEQLPAAIFDLFRGIIGNHDHQIGSAVFHILYGFCGPEEHLVSGQIHIGLQENVPTFSEVHKLYREQVSSPWTRFCAEYVPANSLLSKAVFAFALDGAGQPMFPSYDEDHITSKAMKDLLSQYLEVLWVPWSDISEHPTDYLSDTAMPAGVNLHNPESMACDHLFQTVMHLHTHQSDPTFTFFRHKKDIHQCLVTCAQAVAEQSAPLLQPSHSHHASPSAVSDASIPLSPSPKALLQLIPTPPHPEVHPLPDRLDRSTSLNPCSLGHATASNNTSSAHWYYRYARP